MTAREKAQALIHWGECKTLLDATYYLADMGEITLAQAERLAATAKREECR